MEKIVKISLVLFLVTVIGCKKDNVNVPEETCDNTSFFQNYSARNFEMGFSTWPYAPTTLAVNNTYQFIENNSDIYSEHIDNKIPWNAWINNVSLPVDFTNDVNARVSKRLPNTKLTLSVSLLNTDRSDLAEDFDGSTPSYSSFSDLTIENAYVKHLEYLILKLSPTYLILALEVNELKIKSPSKWNGYKDLMSNVKSRISQNHPSIRLSESITLHNLYQPEVSNPEAFINEMVTYANQMDFVAISFYPFFKGLHTKEDFQKPFDFLHSKITQPIAFSETSHLSVDLDVDGFNLHIKSTECEQKVFLETLLNNAQVQDYEYIIWWSHRDFYELWLTFPEASKDLGKLWRNTGLITDSGTKRKAMESWTIAFEK